MHESERALTAAERMALWAVLATAKTDTTFMRCRTDDERAEYIALMRAEALANLYASRGQAVADDASAELLAFRTKVWTR